jgi:hypothetical protein
VSSRSPRCRAARCAAARRCREQQPRSIAIHPVAVPAATGSVERRRWGGLCAASSASISAAPKHEHRSGQCGPHPAFVARVQHRRAERSSASAAACRSTDRVVGDAPRATPASSSVPAASARPDGGCVPAPPGRPFSASRRCPGWRSSRRLRAARGDLVDEGCAPASRSWRLTEGLGRIVHRPVTASRPTKRTRRRAPGPWGSDQRPAVPSGARTPTKSIPGSAKTPSGSNAASRPKSRSSAASSRASER